MTGPLEEYAARGNDFLREQLALIDRPDQRKLKRSLTVLEVRCRDCGRAPFVVVATQPYWVVRMHDSDPARLPANVEPSLDLNPYERGAERAQLNPSRPSTRHDVSTFVPISPRGRDDETSLLAGPCRCRTHTITEAWLWRHLDAKRRTATLP